MPTDMVTCPKCGNTFPVGVPRGKRTQSYSAIGFWDIQGRSIYFSCPRCGQKMGAFLESFCCKKDDY